MDQLMRVVLAAAAAGAAGCSPAEPELGRGQLPLCPEFGCTTNSPIVDGMEIAELSESTWQYNGAGLRVMGLWNAGVEYTLAVTRAELLALDDMGDVALSGTMLEDSAIKLEHESGQVYEVRIPAVHDDLTFWVGAPQPILTYTLMWKTEAMAKPEPVCPEVEIGEEWPVEAIEAIIFQGDRYDDEHKEVTAIDAAVGAWFTVACAGSATARMHTTRHTTAGSNAGYQSSQLTRQAMLKMYTADYCGTGRAFTELGEPLAWENVQGWQSLGFPLSDEAVWSSDGARCVDTPRMGDDAPTAALLLRQIEAECGRARPIDSCAGQTWFPDQWEAYGYVRSANP